MNSQTPNTSPDLPPGWQADDSLRDLIPAPCDYRTFRRWPGNPTRFAICICGGGVFDLKAKAFCPPQYSKRKGPKNRLTGEREETRSPRRSYVLPRVAPGSGQRGTRTCRTYARLICELVHGAPPRGDSEAHHLDGDPTNDHHRNVHWETRSANRRMASKRQDRKGENNWNHKLGSLDLDHLIFECDFMPKGGNVEEMAKKYRITVSYLRRLLKGKARIDEVSELRKKHDKQRIDYGYENDRRNWY